MHIHHSSLVSQLTPVGDFDSCLVGLAIGLSIVIRADALVAGLRIKVWIISQYLSNPLVQLTVRFFELGVLYFLEAFIYFHWGLAEAHLLHRVARGRSAVHRPAP